MVQRFSLEASGRCPECGTEQETPGLSPDKRGDYVEYEEHERIVAEMEEVVEASDNLLLDMYKLADELRDDIEAQKQETIRLETENAELRMAINRFEEGK